MLNTIQDRLDHLSQRRITDMLAHAMSYYDRGDDTMGELVDELTLDFATQMDQTDGIVWMRRLAEPK
jgi:hypothetical protein